MKVKFHRIEKDEETIEITIRKRTWVRISTDYIIIDKRGIKCLNDSWAFLVLIIALSGHKVRMKKSFI